VRLPHVEDDPDARWRDPGEVGDVADPPRPHLGDEEAGGRGDSADRQRDADLAVVGAFGGHGLGAGAQDLGEQVLGRGLPGRPRDPDDGEIGGSIDDGSRDRAEGRLHVVGEQVGDPGDRARGQRGDRTGFLGGADEGVPVGVLADAGDIEAAGPTFTGVGDDGAVDEHPSLGRVGARRAAVRVHQDGTGGPREVVQAQRDHRLPSVIARPRS
jgi:hypothetical protein